MTAPTTHERSGPTLRQRDRRQAFADLLASLTRAIDDRNDVGQMRAAFESALAKRPGDRPAFIEPWAQELATLLDALAPADRAGWPAFDPLQGSVPAGPAENGPQQDETRDA